MFYWCISLSTSFKTPTTHLIPETHNHILENLSVNREQIVDQKSGYCSNLIQMIHLSKP